MIDISNKHLVSIRPNIKPRGGFLFGGRGVSGTITFLKNGRSVDRGGGMWFVK